MKRFFYLLIVFLLLASLACNVGGSGTDDEESTTSSSQQDSSQPDNQGPDESNNPAPASVDDNQPPPNDSSQPPPPADADLSKINSFRSTMIWRAEFFDGSTEEVSIQETMTRNPFAYHSVTEILNQNGNVERIELVQIGDQRWTGDGNAWVQTQGDPTFETTHLSVTFADYTDQAEHLFDKLGKEKVNGIQTQHYELSDLQGDETRLWWVMTTMGSYNLSKDATDFTNLRDELWLADEPDLPAFAVQQIREAEGKDDEGNVVQFYEERSISDLNNSFDIQPPAGAPAGWPPADVPLYPGSTTDMTTAAEGGGVILLTSGDDVDTVTEYYETSLPGLGWSRTGEPTKMAGMVMETWGKDGRVLTLVINSQGDGSNITLTEAGQ